MTDEDRKESDGEVKPEYQIIPTDENALSEEDLYSFRNTPEVDRQEPPTPPPQEISRPSLFKSWIEKIVDSATGKKPPFLALGVVVGVPLAIVLVVGAWYLIKPQPLSNDLRLAIFDAAGLKGHLITKWEGRAEYQLRIEPIYQQQLAGFTATVTNPPRPLSVGIRLMDSSGFILCEKNILLKYAPRNAAIYAGTNLQPSTEKTYPVQTGKDSAAQEVYLARQEVEELDREHEQDIFQNVIGSDGQLAAISAQGDLPCPAESYRRISSWDMTADFPILAEQVELQKRQAWIAARPGWSAHPSHAAESRAATIKSLPSPIEGDDVITGDNPSKEIVKTASGREFIVNRSEWLNPASGWLVFPASIHYRCDKNAACILTRPGTTVVQHARLKK